MGRFINADAFASTGQGLLGNNMFAYCGNNSVNYVDSSGTMRTTFLGDNHIFSDNILAAGGGAITNSSRSASIRVIENELAYINNADEGVVLDAENFAFYKGALIVKVPSMEYSAFSFGIILMGSKVKDPNLVRHEYGHTLQLKEVGIDKYIAYVVIPSVTCFHLTQKGVLPQSIYYSLPWEYVANMYGEADADYTVWADAVANSYWNVVRSRLQ